MLRLIPLRAVLFDLDDTLLENDMATFGPAYLELFDRRLAQVGPGDRLSASLRSAIDAVLQHDDPAVTNEQCFWRELAAHSGLSEAMLRSAVDRFCAEDFPRLRDLTRPRPEAPDVVRQARARGWSVVLATNPMFPAATVRQRVTWAGLSDRDFDYITTPENSYACKPSPTYFHTILRAVDAQPGEALMVGDNRRLDIAPAIELGLRTFWLSGETWPAESPPPDASGSWQTFLSWWAALD